MKILQLVSNYFGTPLYARLFEKIAAAGVENEIFVPASKKSAYTSSGNIKVSLCFNILDRLLYKPKQLKIIDELQKCYDFGNIDLVHEHMLFSTGYVAMKLHSKYKIPYIVAVRNTDVNVFFKYMLHLRHIGVEIMRRASVIVFLSPAYQKQVIETCIPKNLRTQITKKSVVIPNGIDSYFLENKPPPRALKPEIIRLIQVGEINSNKNPESTVKAAELLRRKGLDVELTLVGKMKGGGGGDTNN